MIFPIFALWALPNVFLLHCGNAEISRTDNYREVVVFFDVGALLFCFILLSIWAGWYMICRPGLRHRA